MTYQQELQAFIEKSEQPMYIELNNICKNYRKDIFKTNLLLTDFLNKYKHKLLKHEIFEIEARLAES